VNLNRGTVGQRWMGRSSSSTTLIVVAAMEEISGVKCERLGRGIDVGVVSEYLLMSSLSNYMCVCIF
jgi:hypothetical protein